MKVPTVYVLNAHEALIIGTHDDGFTRTMLLTIDEGDHYTTYNMHKVIVSPKGKTIVDSSMRLTFPDLANDYIFNIFKTDLLEVVHVGDHWDDTIESIKTMEWIAA